jgi:hypothetical protein
MKRAVLMILILVMFGARSEILATDCSSYYISEVNIVSVADTEAGNVQTYVGFGHSKEESEQNALGPAHMFVSTCRLAWNRIAPRAATPCRTPRTIRFISST